MKKLYYIFLLLIVSTLNAFSQEMVSLEICQAKAVEIYPLTRQRELNKSSSELKIENINKNYLPVINVNGQLHYQSDVTKMPFQNIPGMDALVIPKDWYKINLDATQAIYDGGITSKQKALEEVNLQIDQQTLELELYQLKERVNLVYFNILVLQESNKTLVILKENLKAKLKDVETGIKNGIVLSSNADILKAEIIGADQKIAEIEISLKSTVNILNEMTGLGILDAALLQIPQPEINLENFQHNRLEYAIMELQQNKINALKGVTSTKRLPKFSAFGQLGYGRPGYDMLNPDFDDYYMIGARLNWNLWDWNHTKKEKEILNIQNEMIYTQMQSFDQNLKIDLENKTAEINKYVDMIIRDQDIIELRTKIVKASSSQLDNGVITSTEYLVELNAETQAKLNLEAHRIMLIKAKQDYLISLGKM